MSDAQVGAILTSGPQDWQILQQDASGQARLALAGRWVHEQPGRVEVRLVDEANSAALSTALDWQAAETRADGTWSHTLTGIPAGGLYRLETRYNPTANVAGEWSPRGDMRHFLGVGDLWVIAGQSNSAGYGRGPVNDPPELGVHLFRNSEQWALATHPMNESTDTCHAVNREAANSGHSPYLHFARVLKQRRGTPIGLIQTSLGGSPLSRWNPIENPSADLYANMLKCIALCGGQVRGVLWYQGESDCGGENARSYARRFTDAVAAWRRALGQPGLVVLTVQLNRLFQPSSPDADRDWSLVREAQRQVPHLDTLVAVSPALDLPLSDTIHVSPAGNLLLGERMARAALALAHGEAVDYRAPELVTAVPSGTSEIVLTFAPVTSRIDNFDATSIPFVVQDADGVVPVTKVAYSGPRATLTLGRALAAAPVVSAGVGLNPPTLPMDMERFLPILAFYQAPVAAAATPTAAKKARKAK